LDHNAGNLKYLDKAKVWIPSRADIMVHVVPVVVFELLGTKFSRGDFVVAVIRSMESVPVVNLDGGIGMARRQACGILSV
jgi:hypothetical protein